MTSADEFAWARTEMPPDVLQSGSLLAKEFRSLHADLADDAKRTTTERFTQLKKEPYREPAPGSFAGDDLDRLRLLLFSNESGGIKKAFDMAMPSAVLRERSFSAMSTTEHVHRLSSFQKLFCLEQQVDLVGRCLASRPDGAVTTEAEDDQPYTVSAHTPSVFPEKIFSLASGRLHLEMLKSFRLMNPAFFQNGMAILVRTLLDCPPLSLRAITPKTAEATMLDDLSAFCSSILSDATGLDEEAALALLCALGASSGRVRYILTVVRALLSATASFPSPPLATSVETIVRRLETHRLKLELGQALPRTILKQFHLSGEGAAQAIASDGKHLYLWSPEAGLSKVGTGYHGSVAGNVYATVPSAQLLRQLQLGAMTRVQLANHLDGLLLSAEGSDDLGSAVTKHAHVRCDLSMELVELECPQGTLCTDGVYVYVLVADATTWSLHKLDPRAQWQVVETTSEDVASANKDVQAFMAAAEPIIAITNGSVVTMYRYEATQFRYVAFAPDTGLVSATVTKVTMDGPIAAMSFDPRNNLIWTTKDKAVVCHLNEGPRVSLLVRDTDAIARVDGALRDSATPGYAVLLRLLRVCDRVVDSYLGDDDASSVPLDIPFGVDLHEHTFQDLVGIVDAGMLQLDRGEIGVGGQFVLTVALKLLALNTSAWITAKAAKKLDATHHAIAEVVVAGRLKATLQRLIALPDAPTIVRAARQLFLLALDIFYPTVEAQWGLLATYLGAALTTAEEPILHMLLQRLASQQKMQALVHSFSPEVLAHIDAVVAAATSNALDQLDGRRTPFVVAAGKKLVHLVLTILRSIVAGYRCGNVEITVVGHYIGGLIGACDQLCVRASTVVTDAALDILEPSLLGVVAPPLFSFVELLLASIGAEDASRDGLCEAFVPAAQGFLDHLQPLLAAGPPRERFVESKHKGQSSVVFESEHEYRNDMHEVKELRLEGAATISITFDERSRTEFNYDYVVFYTDKSCTTFYGEEKYSGRDSSFNWPGVGGNLPLIIGADHCFVLFHSDGSNTDWGYKFTAVANVTENSRSYEMHWLTCVEQNVLDALGRIIDEEARWLPPLPEETATRHFLESDLLHGGFADVPSDDHVLGFLHALVEADDAAGESPAAHVARVLKVKTPQDQGAVPHINRAVRAVAAAILHHNMWSVDAYALGQGLRLEPSPTLLRAWKNAQKMRNWFDLGDAQRPLLPVADAKPALQRQPSAYSGASEDALRTLCANVEARATFLLQLGPASFSLAASEDPTAASKRWGLLAKYGVALKKADDPASILEKWHSLVDEVEAATQLKKMMLYRKSSAGRHDGSHEKTMTELVLEFVQSDVGVDDLLAAVRRRNQRAAHRRLGILIATHALNTTANPRLGHIMLQRASATLTKLDARKVNLFNQLHGCGVGHRNALREAFASYLFVLKRLLETPDTLLQTSALRCIALDYDTKDGDILHESGVVPAVFALLTTPAQAVRAAAQSCVRVLLERFVVNEKTSNVQTQLASCVKAYVATLGEPHSSACQLLSRDAPGANLVTTKPIPSVAFWMYVLPVQEGQLHVGTTVKHGPHWKGPVDARKVGVVTGIFNNVDVSVRWAPQVGEKETNGSHIFDVASSVFEVVPAALDPSGQILLQSHVLADSWLARLVGLALTPTCHLEIAVADGSETAVTMTSSTVVVPGIWHHVSLLPSREDSLALTVNGDLVLEVPLPAHLKQQEHAEARLLESEHPHEARGWQYFAVDLAPATLLRVAFDKRSATGDEDSYMVFYRDESHTLTWGEARYSAGTNLPGVDGNSPLEIPSGKFVLGVYTSDSTTDLWGFRLWAYVVIRGAATAPLSRLYLGEPPGRVLTNKAARCFLHGLEVDVAAPLTPEAVADARPALDEAARPTLRVDITWHVLSCLLACVAHATDAGRQVLTYTTLPSVLNCAFTNDFPVALRCAAARVLARSLALCSTILEKHTLLEYTERAFDFISNQLHPWRPPATPSVPPQQATLLGVAYAEFIQAACTHRDVSGAVESRVRAGLAMTAGVGDAFASAFVLGGVFDGAHVGSRVKSLVKRDNPEGSFELGWIVGLDVVGGTRAAQVLFDLDLSRFEVVPLDKVVLEPPPESCASGFRRLFGAVAGDVTRAVVATTASDAISLDFRARLLKVLSRYCESSSAETSLQSLVLPLIALAKKQPSAAPMPVPPATKVLESTHPYRDSLEVYETVSFPGAKWLRIEFDVASRTEKDCDYVIFYKEANRTDAFWGEERYSGRDGSENFPGYGDRSVLVIPASHFTYYWRTDSSNNDWGWRFTVTACFNPLEPATLTLPQLNQRLYHLSDMLLELHTSVGDDSVAEATPQSPTLSPPTRASAGSVSMPLMYLGDATPSNNWTVVAPDGVDVFDNHGSTDAIGRLARGTVVEAAAIQGTWMQVEHATTTGWCLMQQNGLRNFVREALYEPMEHSRASPATGADAAGNDATKADLLDDADTETNTTPESHFDVSTIHAALSRSPWELARGLLEIMTVKYAQACLRSYVTAAVDDVLAADTFLELAQLFIDELPTPQGMHRVLAERLQKHAATPGHFRMDVVSTCSAMVATVLSALPAARPLVQVVEALRPNQFERIHLPGAASIRIEFDPATHCDSGHVMIFDRNGAAGEEPYCGSASSGNWPGVRKNAPLVIPSDAVSVFFAVDHDSSEALVMFTAYGDVGPVVAAPDAAAFAPLRLALWAFTELARVGGLRPHDVRALLDILCQLYQQVPEPLQLQILEIWSHLFQQDAEWCCAQLSPLDMHRFMAFLKTKLWAQYGREDKDDVKKSKRLRSLLQCVVDVDQGLERYMGAIEADARRHQHYTWAAQDGIDILDAGSGAVKLDSQAPSFLRAGQSHASGLHVWDLRVHALLRQPRVGLVTPSGTAVTFDWASASPSPIVAGDVLTVELDLRLGRVRYARNGAAVGEIAVPLGQSYAPAVELCDAHDAVYIRQRLPLQWLRQVNAENPPWYQRIVATIGKLRGFGSHFQEESATNTCDKTDAPASGVLTMVVRGVDWIYGDEDGGCGNVGVVISCEPWAGHPNSAVRVLWLQNKATALYRYGYHGLFDVAPAANFPHPQPQPTDVNTPTTLADVPDNHGGGKIEGLPSLHGDFTVQLWLRREAVVAEAQVIFHVATEAGWWMRLVLDGKRRLQFHVHTDQGHHIICPKPLELAAWTRIELCAFGSGIGFHVNGALCHHDRLFVKTSLPRTAATTMLLGTCNDDAVGLWSGDIAGVRLWDAPLHMPTYYRDVLHRSYNSIDLGELTPTTFDDLVRIAAAPVPKVPDVARELNRTYRDFTLVNKHADFASLRPRGVGVLAPTCPYGKVYYELTLVRCTCVQLGWSFGDCKISARDMGIGDCALSFGLDLCRQAIWNEDSATVSEAIWQPGDVLGCLLDWHAGEMTFSLNGRTLVDVSFKRDEGRKPAWRPPTPTMDGLRGLWGDDDEDEEDYDDNDEEDSESGASDDGESDQSSGTSDGSGDDNGGDDAVDGEVSTAEAKNGPFPQAASEPPTVGDTSAGNAWLEHGGIFPSGSFLTGDGAIWNLGQRPFQHLPEGYISVLQASGLPANAKIEFEIFDFDEKCWQVVAYRHGVLATLPRLIGAWPGRSGSGSGTNPDASSEPVTAPLASPQEPQLQAPRFTRRFHAAHEALDVARLKENEELVRFVNHACVAKSLDCESLLNAKWEDVAPQVDELVRWPLVAALAPLPAEDPVSLSSRFALLVALNNEVLVLLRYVDLVADIDPMALASRVAAARGLIFGPVKRTLWDAQLAATATPTLERPLTLNRPKAARNKTANGLNRFALFAQAYRALASWVPANYRSEGNLYKVTFLGENAVDGGGPYRETFTEFCAELQSPQLPLLLPTSNGQHNVGHFRDAYVLHPTAHASHPGMLVFLGKLLGVAIRTRDCLGLTLSQVVWKLLVRDTVTLDDLEAVDALIVNSMRSLRLIEASGVTETHFADVITETFTTLSTDNRVVPLVPRGDSVAVTFANRATFADLVEAFRLHEFDASAECVRRGLGMVVPLRYLRLFTWAELEAMVCGSPDVDIALLEQCTEYSSCSRNDEHVGWFWDVLRAYSHDARRAFLRFVWGRSRLPRTLHEFQLGQRFKLQAFDRRPADSYMPVSHTCFFSLELPRYSSREVLEARLTYAIYNCQAIDGDGDTMAANQLGWED
ncbi:HECT E3 ubiquitin ligase [Achlya hypogyna]|uniref:HECT E3 ubiquitin ligase n=1 Tax=Achlya hypogyna TaxID=1202772 RepID=A0A1V9ZEJ7_ACHHY|nr:HECT E3 ubiquitin ligase [Achlya hypogyna]